MRRRTQGSNARAWFYSTSFHGRLGDLEARKPEIQKSGPKPELVCCYCNLPLADCHCPCGHPNGCCLKRRPNEEVSQNADAA
jgi:hypothetical protein